MYKFLLHMSKEASNTQVTVFWVLMPHSDVVGYQYFGGLCCLHLHDSMIL